MGTAIKMLQLLVLQHSVATLRKNVLNVRNVRNYFLSAIIRNVRNYFLYPQLSAIVRNVRNYFMSAIIRNVRNYFLYPQLSANTFYIRNCLQIKSKLIQIKLFSIVIFPKTVFNSRKMKHGII